MDHCRSHSLATYSKQSTRKVTWVHDVQYAEQSLCLCTDNNADRDRMVPAHLCIDFTAELEDKGVAPGRHGTPAPRDSPSDATSAPSVHYLSL